MVEKRTKHARAYENKTNKNEKKNRLLINQSINQVFNHSMVTLYKNS